MFNYYRKEIEWAGRKLVLETGKIARQADGAVTVTYGETMVLCTVVGDRTLKPGQDFFPLTVNYQEKTYAVGKIPSGFFKREGRPSEHETLISRLIDRPIRPLFPEGFCNEVQVIATVLTHDMENDPAIAALIASHKIYGLLPLVCATMAVWIIIASLSDIAQRVALLRAPFKTSISRAYALPRSIIGVAIAHIGVGITVLGISAMSQAQHLIVEIPIGTTKHLAGYDWTLTRIAKKHGPNYMALVATLEVRNNGKLIATLHPARRHFNTQNQTIAHVSIASLPFADLYSVLGKQRTIDHTTTYVLKLHNNPLASWIWIGALVMVIGSTFSFSDRRNKHSRHILQRQHLSSPITVAL